MRVDNSRPARRQLGFWLNLAVVLGVVAALGPASATDLPEKPASGWSPFVSFFDANNFSAIEQIGLFVSVGISFFALAYAWVLGKKVFAADQGTKGMQAIAQAVNNLGLSQLGMKNYEQAAAQFRRAIPLW